MRGAPDIPAALNQVSELAGPVFEDASGQLPMFLEFWTQSSRDPALWEQAIAPYRRFCGMFAAFLRRGVAEGSLAPLDAQLAARSLMALGLGVLLQGLMDPQGAPWDQVARSGFQVFIKGMQSFSGKESGGQTP
jgi:hypothetical protein